MQSPGVTLAETTSISTSSPPSSGLRHFGQAHHLRAAKKLITNRLHYSDHSSLSRSKHGVHERLDYATTPCASLPSSTTLLSSGIFSNTCTYGAPYRNNRTNPARDPPWPANTTIPLIYHPVPGHRLSEPATTPLVSNRVYLHLILPITTVHR